MKPVALTTGLGEVMEPGTLVTALILSPEGRISVEPGALHGRSEVESSLQFAQKRDQLAGATTFWFVWVAVELDGTSRPVRYKGVAVSELLVDQASRAGYRSVTENVNRMSEAMRGGINLKTLDERAKSLIREQLIAVGASVWDRSAPTLKEALG